MSLPIYWVVSVEAGSTMPYKKWRTFQCRQCGVTFSKLTYTKRDGGFCSTSCRNQWRSIMSKRGFRKVRTYDQPVLPKVLNYQGSKLLAAAVIRQSLLDRDLSFLRSDLGSFFCDLAGVGRDWVVRTLWDKKFADTIQAPRRY